LFLKKKKNVMFFCGILAMMFFCFKTKEPKVQGSNFLGYKIRMEAKVFELASLRQQILFNASILILLTPQSLMP